MFYNEEERSKIDFLGDLDTLSWFRVDLDRIHSFSSLLDKTINRLQMEMEINPIEFGCFLDSLTNGYSLFRSLKSGFYYRKTVNKNYSGSITVQQVVDPIQNTDSIFSLILNDSISDLSLDFGYSTQYFKHETIGEIARFFISILETVSQNENCLLESIPPLSASLDFFCNKIVESAKPTS